METKDLNSIGLAYLEMVEKRNIESKANHAAGLAAALDEKMDPTDHVKQNDNGMWCVYSKDNKKLKEFKKESDANAWAVDNHDTLMSEAKKKLHPNQKALDADGDGDIEADDLADLRKDADKDDKKFDKKKKSSKKDDDDEQEKFKAYTGDDKDGQQGAAIGEDKEDKFEPHMMYDPKTGKGYKAEKEEDHLRMKKMGYTHDKPEEIDEAMTMVSRKPHPEGGHIVTLKDKDGKKVVRHLHKGKVKTISKESVEIDEATDLQEGAARQAAFHKGLMDYCKDIGKDHMDHKDFADHAKHVKAGNWDKARTHADDQDTEVREKIHSLAIDHLGQGAASELYGGDRVSLSKNKGDGKLHASYNESVNVDDVLALIDQGYTLDQAEAMVAEACGTVNASRKQSKAGEIDKNIANDQRSLPVSGKDDIPVRPGTKQQQRDFDKGAKMAKSKDKVSVSKAPWDTKEGFTSDAQRKAVWASKNDAKNEELSVGQKKIAKQTPPRNKITGDDFKHLRKHGHGNSPQKESVMDRVSNMVENIRVDIQEKNEINELDKKTLSRYVKKASGDMAVNAIKTGDKNPRASADAMKKVGKRSQGITRAVDKMAKEDTTKINEVSKKTLRNYVKAAVPDIEKQKADADKFEFRGMASQSRKVMDKNFKKSNRAGDKIDNRKAGINTAVDKMTEEGVPTTRKELQKYRFAKEYEKRGMKYPYSTADTSKADEKEARAMIAQISNREKKESVQEAAKPTGIHHPIDPMPGKEVNSKDAAGRAADIRARRNPLSMTEKEFVEMHQVPTTVAPEFDGNIAAKQTAENAKKAPIKQAKTPNIPTAKGDQTVVKSTQAPAANAGVVGESYMDKYAKYIRGDK